jgi:hypothetical protein
MYKLEASTQIGGEDGAGAREAQGVLAFLFLPASIA